MDAKSSQDYKQCDASLRLLMYTSMSDKDSAYNAGFVAAKHNIDLDENPFSQDDSEYTLWEEGWWQGFYDESYTSDELIYRLSVDYQITESESNTELGTTPQTNSSVKSKLSFMYKIYNYFFDLHNDQIQKLALMLSILAAILLGLDLLIID